MCEYILTLYSLMWEYTPFVMLTLYSNVYVCFIHANTYQDAVINYGCQLDSNYWWPPLCIVSYLIIMKCNQCTQTHTHVHIHTHICTHTYTHTCTNTHKHTHTYAYAHRHACMHIHTCMHLHMPCMHMHARTHARTHTHRIT